MQISGVVMYKSVIDFAAARVYTEIRKAGELG